MFPRYLAGLVFCEFLLVFCTAQASHDYQSGDPFYFGFAFGFAGADQECDYHGYDCDGNDESFKVYGGKRLHENIAVEVSYQDLGRLRDRNVNLTTVAESEGLNVSLHGIIPVEGIGYFYGKAGYILWDTEYTRIDARTVSSDDDGSDFTYGVGFAFMFGQKYDFRIEYERLNELGDEFVPGGDHITVISFGGTIYLE